MNRKKFLQALAGVPLLNIPFRALSNPVPYKVCKTQKDAEGPFYKANAPLRSVIEIKGQPLRIEGRVFSEDCETPVRSATLDIWHCDNEGNYDLKGFKGRGQVKTDNNGRYSFTTIFPPPYGNRPRHIHIKVRAHGKPELTTQLYFQGDPDIQNDFARNAEQDRVITLKSEHELKIGIFDIYL
jgi:catechol 1,2-dioxygenase